MARYRTVPRDEELIYRLYWIEGKNLHQVGAALECSHASVAKIMAELGIPRRKRKDGLSKLCREPDCDQPVFIRSAKRAGYLTYFGTRCLKHDREYHNEKAMRYYRHVGRDIARGLKDPQSRRGSWTEEQLALDRAKRLMRGIRSHIKYRTPLESSKSPTPESAPVTSSRT